MRLLTITLCWLLVACADDKPIAPPLPNDGGSGSGGVGGFIVGGSGGTTDEDSGGVSTDAATDAPTTPPTTFASGECVDRNNLPRLTNQVFLPTDFTITRGFAHWTGTCADPVLEIGLSDGDCPDGDQHELLIQIDADAITEQTIFIPGANQLALERPDLPFRVRYTRPNGASPVGTWGTCRGVAGAINIESLDISRGGRLAATFDFDLAACDGSGASTFAIGGSLDLSLARRLTDVCP